MRERSESEARFLRDDVLPLWVRAKGWSQADLESAQGAEQNGRYIPSSQSEHAPGGSPTQTHTTKDDEPAVDIEAWLDHLMGELRRLDAARPEEIRGCSEPEMRQILAECPFGNPPSAYVGFMRRAGRGAGNLFRGSDLYYPACLGTGEYARECQREEDDNVPLGDRFFFGHHQGYVLYFFKPDDERVWQYTLEGEGKGETVAATNFPAFVDSVAIPGWHWARFREDDANNWDS